MAERGFRSTLGTGLVVLAATACATTATGRKQLSFMPSSEVNAMGVQAFDQMKQEQKVETDPEIVRYVRCIADPVAEAAGLESWEVVVFEDESANAFALPGGKIGVFTGLLDVAKTPEQLAAVLGHEVAHVTQEHSNERLSQAFMAQGGLTAVSAALGGSGQAHDIALGALGLGAEYGVLMPFGRTQESEADVVGLDYMARAGFDPRGAVELWHNMHAAAGDGPPEFLSTHPSHETRVKDLEAKMDDALSTYRSAVAKGDPPACARERGLGMTDAPAEQRRTSRGDDAELTRAAAHTPAPPARAAARPR